MTNTLNTQSQDAHLDDVATALETATDWWRGAVIYQIYPRSFKDTSGNGIGDLKGIAENLDYVADLGVDGVWLSPFFKSPMRDFGYDVADYCDVDPVFGTLSDFDKVIEKAHRLGLRVIIDQVYSHTSDQHDWFSESRSSRDNEKAAWYVWADPKADGSPPNNWLSVFNGSSWTWDTRRKQYYFHNFLNSQPDLNLHNAQVQEAILDVSKFWLDRGVNGFRLDAINFGMHDPLLRDNPPIEKNPLSPAKPFDFQHHIYNQSHSDIAHFLERLRNLTNQYDGIFTIGEIGGPDPLAEMKAYTAAKKRLNSAYSFSFLYADKLTPDILKSALNDWTGDADEGWPSWAFSNHDAPRAVSRWADQKDREQAARLYALLLMSLRGNVFLYQGEELALSQADVPYADLKDPEAIANWPVTLGRDGARTPMPWNNTEPNAGFSKARPWLPVNAEHHDLAVNLQQNDPDSVLNFMRNIISVRKNNPVFRLGDLRFIDTTDGLLVFEREWQGQEALCVFNLTNKMCAWNPTNSDQKKKIINVGISGRADTMATVLPPLTGFVAVR